MERINVVYKGVDGAAHAAFITPLARKEGFAVLHTVLSTIAGSVDQEVLRGMSGGGVDPGAIVAFVSNAIRAIDFDTFWGVASKLLRYATIDLKECKDLDSFDGFNGAFADLYPLVFAALKANYPDFFGLMGRGGSLESTAPKTEGV